MPIEAGSIWWRWCNFMSVLPFTGKADCAAEGIVALELAAPCHGDARKVTALFTDECGQPYTYARLNRMFHTLMVALFSTSVAATLSWHSIRIGLASSLREAGCPDPIIQILCRWASLESLQTYALIKTSKHIHWMDRAADVEVDALRAHNLPALDNSLEFAQIHTQLAGPSDSARNVVAAASQQRSPHVPPPVLARGTRIDVYWTGHTTWYTGTFTSSKQGYTSDGSTPARLYRVLYDATSDFPRPSAAWHDLTEVAWRRTR